MPPRFFKGYFQLPPLDKPFHDLFRSGFGSRAENYLRVKLSLRVSNYYPANRHRLFADVIPDTLPFPLLISIFRLFSPYQCLMVKLLQRVFGLSIIACKVGNRLPFFRPRPSCPFLPAFAFRYKAASNLRRETTVTSSLTAFNRHYLK
jgi:hypothetical protein